jgi:hypothetical protein
MAMPRDRQGAALGGPDAGVNTWTERSELGAGGGRAGGITVMARLPQLDAVAKLMSLGGSSETRMTIDPPRMLSRDEARVLCLKRYFTGAPCRRGHVAERYVSSCRCVECDRVLALEWRVANLEKARERERAAAYKYRAANPEKDRERKRKWRAANPEKAREHQRRWLAANKDKIDKRQAALRQAPARA